MRSFALLFCVSAILAPALGYAAEKPAPAVPPDCDARPNAYMRVECRVIIDPSFDQKWRRMTPSEMQDAVDADPCVGFFSADLEKQCRDGAPKKSE